MLYAIIAGVVIVVCVAAVGYAFLMLVLKRIVDTWGM